MASAVNIYGLDHPRLARTVKAKLEKLKAETLLALPCAQGWDDFNKRVGQIRGIEDAIALCEQTEKEERA